MSLITPDVLWGPDISNRRWIPTQMCNWLPDEFLHSTHLTPPHWLPQDSIFETPGVL